MKRIIILVGLLMIATQGVAMEPKPPSQAVPQKTVRITNGEWPPYLSQKLLHYGVASRIVTEAFALEGVKVKYGFFVWKRAYDQAKAGRWDGSVVWSRTPEREKLFHISDPVIPNNFVFFHLKSYAFDWKTMQDLKGIKIGATKEYNYGEAFSLAEQSKMLKVTRVVKDEANFKKLLKGKIKLFPSNPDVGYDQIQKLFPPEQAQRFTHHPTPLLTNNLHLLLSKKVDSNQELIQLFNQGLQRLRESGQLDQYLAESREGKYKRP